MSSDAIVACADMTFADMVVDYAGRTGLGRRHVWDALIASGAYDALYVERTGLWAAGPDACLDFHEQLAARQPVGYPSSATDVLSWPSAEGTVRPDGTRAGFLSPLSLGT